MKQILRLVTTAFVLFFLFFLLLFSVNIIPQKFIRNNVIASVKSIDDEGLYRKILGFKLFQLDNYTDVLMLDIAYSGDSKQPLRSAVLCNYIKSPNYLDLAKSTEAFAMGNSKGLSVESYGRYWHGYLITLKPLLIFLNHNQIRILNYVFMTLLLIIVIARIYNRLGLKITCFFALSLIAIGFPMVPLSLQFSTIFYISLIGIWILLKKESFLETNDLILTFFFILGALTSFFDFLTTPLVTLGLPLTIFMLFNEENNTLKTVLFSSICWGLGYGLLWASKWILGIILIGPDFMTSVFNQVELRTSSSYKGMNMTIVNILNFVIDGLSSKKLLWPISIIIFISLIIYIYCLRDNIRPILAKNMPFLLVALMFPVWFLILRNHTIQHGWFTWRSICIMIFSLLIFIDRTTDYKRGIFRLRNSTR